MPEGSHLKHILQWQYYNYQFYQFNCSRVCLIRITRNSPPLLILSNLLQPSYFNQRFQPRGCVATPWILVFCEIIYGYGFGVKESNGDSWNFLPLSTLILKVIALVHGCGATPWPPLSRSWSGSIAFIHRFSNSLAKKHISTPRLPF